jgi:predicted transcriptional regulator
MSTALKILDWHHQGGDEIAQQLQELPEGRYALIPETEVEEEQDLSPEDERAIEEGLEEFERGDTVPWERVRAQGRAIIEAARAAKTR